MKIKFFYEICKKNNMEEIKAGEIVYATISIKDTTNKIHELRKVVFSREWDCSFPHLDQLNYRRFLSQNGLLSSKGDIIEAEVIDIKILARTGFKNRAKGYTTAKKNEQIRDSVTGAYV